MATHSIGDILMPLNKSSSDSAFKENVSTLMHEVGESPHVQSKDQALAIAYDVKRRAKKRKRGGKVKIHVGPIDSAVPGRTDKHNMNVESGSYVLPSETISHLGENNTEAGYEIAKRMFPDSGRRSVSLKRASGGAVPVVTAGGEFVVSPSDVRRVGSGDIDHGHKILDHFVMLQRQKHIETLKSLEPPAQD